MREGVCLGEDITFPHGQEGMEWTGQVRGGQDMTGQRKENTSLYMQEKAK